MENHIIKLCRYLIFLTVLVCAGKNACPKGKVESICLVAPDILELVIINGQLHSYPVQEYIPDPGDSIALSGTVCSSLKIAEYCGLESYLRNYNFKADIDSSMDIVVPVLRHIYRNGTNYGWLVGKKGEYYWPVEAVVGKADLTEAFQTESYSLISSTDETFSQGIKPYKISRKSKPFDNARIGPNYEAHHLEEHFIYLHFDQPLKPNNQYILLNSAAVLDKDSLIIDLENKSVESSAIHVNLAGYHPQQQIKRAFLSTWLGNGGGVDYNFKKFEVVSGDNGETIYEGEIVEFIPGDAENLLSEYIPYTSLSGTKVYIMEFGNFSIEGNYRIKIENLGVSPEFRITSDIWNDAMHLQMKGFLHKRSGIALGPPYTNYTRPRNHHPVDGFTVYSCNKDIFWNKKYFTNSEWDAANPFIRIAKSIDFTTKNPGAWGGWMDAADYDRRWLHLRTVNMMMNLYELNEDYFRKTSFNIPESDNTIPDILDEALWCTDMFLRTQGEDGEVCQGIESIRHPSAGETSWMESLPLALIPGNNRSAVWFAGTAARMSLILQEYDTEKAELYKTSALKAYNWYLKHRNNKDWKVDSYRVAFMNLNLYLLTGDNQFHENYVHIIRKHANNLHHVCVIDVLNSGILQYININKPADAKLQQALKDKLIDYADRMISFSNLYPYGEFYYSERLPLRFVQKFGLSIIIAAHQLTKDQKYLNAIEINNSYAMGANPFNLALTSGMGNKTIRPWDAEAEYVGLQPADGIPVFGPFYLDPDKPLPPGGWQWSEKRVEPIEDILYPDIKQWPMREAYFDRIKSAMINEYTVHENMIDQLLSWGYLAQYYSSKTIQEKI